MQWNQVSQAEAKKNEYVTEEVRSLDCLCKWKKEKKYIQSFPLLPVTVVGGLALRWLIASS